MRDLDLALNANGVQFGERSALLNSAIEPITLEAEYFLVKFHGLNVVARCRP